MAALQHIDHGPKHRDEIKTGDIVTVATRGVDHLHIVTDATTGGYDLVSLLNGSQGRVRSFDVCLFRGSAKIYNVL